MGFLDRLLKTGFEAWKSAGENGLPKVQLKDLKDRYPMLEVDLNLIHKKLKEMELQNEMVLFMEWAYPDIKKSLIDLDLPVENIRTPHKARYIGMEKGKIIGNYIKRYQAIRTRQEIRKRLAGNG